MAEGGHDNPFDPLAGEAGVEEVGMRTIRHDEETPSRHDEEEETSFGGSETEPLLDRERSRDRAWEEIKSRFPSCDPRKAKFTAGIDDLGRIAVRLTRIGGKTYPLLGADGELNEGLPKTIRESLGEPASAIVRGNGQANERDQEEIDRLREGLLTGGEQRRVEELEARIERREAANEAIEERLPLRERVKKIFKKQGLTILSVLTATGVVIGVIVSNLKSGLTKMSKGIGNGLKDIGKKLAGILPGIVGSIVSFLFKTAGEAIGFLSKHAWLLILLVVTFVVEQFKSRA